MHDVLGQALATPGLVWLLLTISVAGIVRGFTGFGTALIFVPVAGVFLAPQTVIALITLTGVASTAALLPRAWTQSDRGEVGILVFAALITVPAGLWLLSQVEAETVRWIIACIAAATLAALISGWRFTRRVTSRGLVLIGAAAGLIGGLTGLTGPIVILFYLAGQAAVQSVRANTILYLAALDFVIVANLLIGGDVRPHVFLLALILAVPYFITTLVGQSLFDPRHERLYRWAAYGVIALAVAGGLPLWT